MALNTATLLSSSILLLLIASSSAASFGNVLRGGDILSAGGFLSINSYKFTLQNDCNLVLYDNDAAIWASHTQGMGNNCTLVLQGNGELFIYSDWSAGTTAWRSEAGGAYGKYTLVLQPNGNVVVYGNPVWSTGTRITSRTSDVHTTQSSASGNP